MQNSFDYANLYVEKYSNGKLLLDFTIECEFLYFAHNGNYTENMRLDQYEATMLYFSNVEDVALSEGDIIVVSMQQLVNHKWYANQLYVDNIQDSEVPYNIFMSFENGSWLTELFNTGEAFKNNCLQRQLIKYVEGTWQCSNSCSLDQLVDKIDIEIVDVGQGSTNLIHSNNCLTVFDFGANIFASKSELRSIAEEITRKFDNSYITSLIISHWDCDHYNLLTVLDDDWVKSFCCVIFPAEVITLTSKLVVRRLIDNCDCICTFKPLPVRKEGYEKIVPIVSELKYALYIGVKGKSTNKSGIALAIKSSKDITIFGADHTNKQIWEYIYPHIAGKVTYNRLNIVVPHHGGKCGKINIPCCDVNPGIAAISVGKNTYKHPAQVTIDIYENLKFDVKRTDWERKNILIKME